MVYSYILLISLEVLFTFHNKLLLVVLKLLQGCRKKEEEDKIRESGAMID